MKTQRVRHPPLKHQGMRTDPLPELNLNTGDVAKRLTFIHDKKDPVSNEEVSPASLEACKQRLGVGGNCSFKKIFILSSGVRVQDV